MLLCHSTDRLSLASSVKTFHVGHFSISGKKLTKHYHFKESEKQDNFITVTSDQGSESLPESGFAWLIHHFSRPNDFVIEIDSKVGKGFCSALKEGRNAFLVNSDTENADSLRHMVGEALTPDILDWVILYMAEICTIDVDHTWMVVQSTDIGKRLGMKSLTRT